MKKFTQLLMVAIVGTTSNIYAQNSIYAGEALRFSRTDYGSSARFKSMGNAQIGIGGDVSSLGGNPAGLGMFTRSELSITPEHSSIHANADFLGQTTKTTENRLNISQGAVIMRTPLGETKRPGIDKGIYTLVIGLGYNKNNDFSGEYNYAGHNQNSSITNAFAERANGTSVSDLTGIAKDAYTGYLIDQRKGSGTQYFPNTSTTDNTQSENEVRRGEFSEINLAAGINISDKVYLGAAIDMVFLYYLSDATYHETGTIITEGATQPNYSIGSPYELDYSTHQVTKGTGVNTRLGMIFKPTDAIRVGATFESPTWMRLEEIYDEHLETHVPSHNNTETSYTEPSDFYYDVRSPYKASLGASMIIGANALLTADIDYVDYSSMKLSDGGYSDLLTENNAFIRQNYRAALNYRIGGEYKIGEFSFRAGYGLNGSPYNDDPDNAFGVKYYSGGIGYRLGMLSVDLTYQHTETTNTFSPYELNDFSEPVSTVKLARDNAFLTVGIRF